MDHPKPAEALPPIPLFQRDLSWIQFNLRVLEESLDSSNPCFERIKFLSITATNLDEFFAIRFASLNKSINQRLKQNAPIQEIAELKQTREQILAQAIDFFELQCDSLEKIAKFLEKSHVTLLTSKDTHRLTESQLQKLHEVYDKMVLPGIGSPVTFSPKNINDLSNLQSAAVIYSPERKELELVPISKAIPLGYSIETQSGLALVTLDVLLHLFLKETLSANSLSILRLTRDSDIPVELDFHDQSRISEHFHTELKKRDLGRPVRLESWGDLDPEVLNEVIKAIKIEPDQYFSRSKNLLYLQGLWQASQSVPDSFMKTTDHVERLIYPKEQVPLPRILSSPKKIFDRLQTRDLLLHHPYDSFEAFVAWIRESCRDPDVQSIDLTIYRTDTALSLLQALKAGAATKRIRVVIELRARFDEQNNLRFANELKQAGIAVFYGFGRLKIHAKIAVVVRLENGSPKTYTHLSTGNYNAATARFYTDLGVLTSNVQIGQDACHFFESITSTQMPTKFRSLVTAPIKLHRRIQALIELETRAALEGNPGRIFAKVNALVDTDLIRSLYRASQAGVEIDLVVRGACALVPGVPGLSDRIRVRSIVDRYLEHSRIYYFYSTDVMYLSSADWMQRNFFSRFEIAFPVTDRKIATYIKEIVIPTYLNDNTKARILDATGKWSKPNRSPEAPEIRSQKIFAELAKSQYAKTPLA